MMFWADIYLALCWASCEWMMWMIARAPELPWHE